MFGTSRPGPLTDTIAVVIAALLGIGFEQPGFPSLDTAWADPGADTNVTTGTEIPDLLGRWTDGPCVASFAIGNRLYQGRGPDLRVADISDPGNPIFLGEIALPSLITDVEVVGDHAYVAAERSGLRILDVSVPSAMVEVSAFTPGNPAYDLRVQGDLVFLADGIGFWILDVTNRAAPTPLHFETTPGIALGIDVLAGIAYVADNTEGLHIYDVSDPALTMELGTYSVLLGFFEKVQVVGDIAYVAEWQGFHTIDVSDPANPTAIGYLDSAGFFYVDVAIDGEIAYVAARGPRGMRVLDVSDPADPHEIGIILGSSTDGAARVYYADGFVYVSDGPEGLRVFDVSTPSAPTEVAGLEGRDFAWDVDVEEDRVYLAEATYGLVVLDWSAPSAPVEIGSFDTIWAAYGVTVRNGLAFVSDGISGLRIVDVSDGTNPVEIGFVNLTDWVYDVEVEGDLVYLANGNDGLVVADVSDPSTPIVLSQVDPSGNNVTRGVDVKDGIVFLGDGSPGLTVIDATDPTSPIVIGGLNTPGSVYRVTYDSGFVYLATGNTGVWVVDVSNPSVPTLAGTFNTPHVAQDIAIDGNRAYVADELAGLIVLDVSDPTNPVLLGSHDTGHWARGVAAVDGRVFVADGYDGAYFFGEEDPAGVLDEGVGNHPGDAPDGSPEPNGLLTSASWSQPNPFRDSIRIGFRLPQAEFVRARLIDIHGRRVRTLADGHFPAGVHELEWDGTDRSGRQAATGTYFYVLETGGEGAAGRTTAGRIMLVR